MEKIKKIWKIDSCFKCPVAGHCLSLPEQRRVLKNSNAKIKGLSNYDLHQKIMANLHTECKVSKTINKLLKQKYSHYLEKYGSLDEHDFMKAWGKAINNENIIPLFYVALVKEDYSVEFLSRIYGDIHVHGFFAADLLARTHKDADTTEKASMKYKALLRKEKRQTRDLVKKNKETVRMLTKFQLLHEEEKKKQYTLKQKKEKKDDTELEIKRIEILYTNQKKELSRLEREKRKAEINMFKAQSSVEQLTSELNQLIAQFSQFSCAQECTESACENYTICSKRILIVGGMTRLESLYRNLVESNGGIFDYHSGRIRNGKNNLDARVKRADMIICPVNCNSHNACIKVKQLCRKYSKTVKMIPNSSLSAIANSFSDQPAGIMSNTTIN